VSKSHHTKIFSLSRESQMLGLVFVLQLWLASQLLTVGAVTRYSAKCTIGSQGEFVPCEAALYSYFSFNVSDLTLLVLPGDEMLCKDESRAPLTSDGDARTAWAVVVNRGACSFEDKARSAAAIGAAALIVINSNSTVFPMGGGSSSFRSDIPVVMVGLDTSTLFESLSLVEPERGVMASLFLSKSARLL
jgi:hypothetical protein